MPTRPTDRPAPAPPGADATDAPGGPPPTAAPGRQGLAWRLAAAALLAAVAQLGWEHLHGGIRTHHLLASSALPGFSNAWGLLLLPGLAGWTGMRLRRRLDRGVPPQTLLAGGLLALTWGLALSAAFSAGREEISSALFLGLLLAALAAPAYRAECLLGWVLGNAFTFGPVIPLLIGGVVAGLSAALHLGLRPVVARAWARRRPAR